jgi:hypothetical protein
MDDVLRNILSNVTPSSQSLKLDDDDDYVDHEYIDFQYISLE